MSERSLRFRAALFRVTQFFQLIAAAMVVGLALRFLIFAVLHVVESRTPQHVVEKTRTEEAWLAPPKSRGFEFPGGGLPPMSSIAFGAAPPTVPLPSQLEPMASVSPPAPPRFAASLIVNAGPPRSEVLVNGVRIGKTPFVGDLSCKEGDNVVVDVVPPRGMPLRFERPCTPTVRVE